MFFKSIRFKVLVWYMFLLAVTLLIFSAALYGSFDKILINNFDDLLSSRAEGIADAIHTYWHAKEVGLLEAGKTHLGSDAQELSHFLEIAREWVEEKRKDPELLKVFSQILDTKGERLAATKTMPFVAPLSREDFEDILAGEDSFDTVSGMLDNARKARFRMYTKPVVEDGKVAYVVQVAGPIDLVSLALHNLIFILFLLLPLTIVLAGIPGVLLAGLTLKPVDKMVDTLKQITAENLKLRIHIPDTKDEIKRLAETFNDMIERLDRSFSSQQNFIQDISYELRMPIAALKEDLKSTLDKELSRLEYEKILQSGLRELDKFSGIIDGLLVLAQFDNSQMPLEIKRVSLNRLLEETLNGVKERAREKDIALSSFLQDHIMLDADEGKLKRLFTNLLDNAVKYNLRKGKISVSAHKDKRFAKVVISDTGVGMPADEIPYIFDRFYQINKSRVSKQSFGLGLSIAKSIIEAHKGRISVESQPGNGAVFTVSLPLSYPG